MTLHIFRNATTVVIAESAADAQAVMVELGGHDADDSDIGESAWRQIDDQKRLTLTIESGPETETQACAEWVEAMGATRCVLASTEI